MDDATAQRAGQAAAGRDVARRLTVAGLRPGDFGVLDVEVRQVHPARTFQRKRGGEGSLCRVTLGDASGEVDLVLWDDEIGLTRDGTLRPGAWLRVQGLTVKDGWKGGVELGIGGGRITPHAAPADAGGAAGPAGPLEGTLTALGDTHVVTGPDGPRFKAEATLQTADGEAFVTLWDDAVKALQGRVGDALTVPDAVPHPVLEGYWVAGTPP